MSCQEKKEDQITYQLFKQTHMHGVGNKFV